MIFAVIVILYLSYVVSRKLGGTVMNHSMSKNIHVIDTVFLGRDKSAVIVRIGQKDYLLGVSQENISLLKELEEGQVSIGMNGNDTAKRKPGDFLEILKNKTGRGKM